MKFSYIRNLVDFVLPPRCPLTGEMVDSQGMVSPDAWKTLSFIAPPYCGACGHPFEFAVADGGGAAMLCAACLAEPPQYTKARAAMTYNDHSRDFILGFKHGDQTQSVVAMVPWLYQAGLEFWKDADVITPVPLHPWRLLRRRYNQAGLMGRVMADRTKIKFIPDILLRTRHTPVQGHLNASERHKNVASAFSIHEKRLADVMGKNIVLIDDVYTTGSTVNECAKILKKAGAGNVYILTLARVVKPHRT